MAFLNIGFGNMVNAARVIAAVSPESAPVKRLVQDGKERGRLIDATQGRRTQSVLITDSDHIILTCLPTETLMQRLDGSGEEAKEKVTDGFCG